METDAQPEEALCIVKNRGTRGTTSWGSGKGGWEQLTSNLLKQTVKGTRQRVGRSPLASEAGPI